MSLKHSLLIASAMTSLMMLGGPAIAYGPSSDVEYENRSSYGPSPGRDRGGRPSPSPKGGKTGDRPTAESEEIQIAQPSTQAGRARGGNGPSFGPGNQGSAGDRASQLAAQQRAKNTMNRYFGKGNQGPGLGKSNHRNDPNPGNRDKSN